MAYLKGRKVRVEVAATYGTAKAITGITNANPGVVTSATHALTNGTAGYITAIASMPRLEGQAARVSATAASTFALEGIDTTNFGTFSGTASFIPVATWLTLSPSTGYSVSGGEPQRQDVTTLLDDIAQEESVLLAAQSVSFDLRSETSNGAALALIESAALSLGFVLFRITFPDGAQRIFRGEPGLANEALQSGQIGNGSLSMSVKGQLLKLA